VPDSLSDVMAESRVERSTWWRWIAAVAILIIGVLPLQTGLHRLGLAFGAPALVVVIIQAWKELAIAALIAIVGWTVLTGATRIRWPYLPGIVLWSVFLGYLCVYAVLAQRASVASIYGLRVYSEPLLAGFAIGIVLWRARRHVRMLPVLGLASTAAFCLAAVQVLLPVSPFVVALRRTAADTFGNLPNAFTVSLVNQFRPFATFSDPNDFGFFAALVVLISFVPGGGSSRAAIGRILLRLLGVAALALSFSRSALLALVAGGATMISLAFLAAPSRLALVKLRTLAPLSVTAIALAATIVVAAPYVPQLRHLANTVSRADPSAKGHVESIAEGVREVSQYPAGMGLGLVGPRAGLYGREGKKFHVESSFLQIAAETGLAGLVLYLLAWGVTFLAVATDAVSAQRDRERRSWAGVAAGCMAAQAAAFVFLPTIVSLQTGVLVWTQVGLLVSASMTGHAGRTDEAIDGAPATA
jgi:hypothetical protein